MSGSDHEPDECMQSVLKMISLFVFAGLWEVDEKGPRARTHVAAGPKG